MSYISHLMNLVWWRLVSERSPVPLYRMGRQTHFQVAGLTRDTLTLVARREVVPMVVSTLV